MKDQVQKINILALSWRDIKNPKMGGAEIHTHQMLSGIDHNRYRIVHFSPMFKEGSRRELIDGVLYLRKGNSLTVIIYAWLYYLKHREKINFVIDQCNVHRFFTPFWVNKKKRIFYIHQLCRELWNIMLKFPLNIIGKIIETPLLKIYKNDLTITVSESTKKDLIAVGFDPDKIHLIHNGLNFQPEPFEHLPLKGETLNFIYIGRYAAYKGIDCAIEALGMVKRRYPDAKLWILGKKDDDYVANVLSKIAKKYNLSIGDSKECDVRLFGFVSDSEKYKILSTSHALVFPSIREGWGIVVIEAACMGTPSIVFNSPGCVDAVDYGHAGYLCAENTSEELARQMIRSIQNVEEYNQLRKAAYDFSSKFNWTDSALKFEHILDSQTSMIL